MKAIDQAGSFADHYDLAIVGAGPAGLMAAITAAGLGIDAVVLDENPSPGGQIYRAVTTSPVGNRGILGKDYWCGTVLAREFIASQASYAPATAVWNIARSFTDEGPGPDFEIGVSLGGQARLLHAKQVILATGAQERPFPIPGWTLPGVLTAGAAQIALKSSGLLPDGRVVLAGTGPLLYLLASQLLVAGTTIAAVLDTSSRANRMAAISALPGFLASPYLAKGLKLLANVLRHLRVVSGVTALRAEGEGRVARVVYEHGRRTEQIECDLLLLHQGVVPSINITSAIGCAHDWDEEQLAFVPRLDTFLASTITGVSVAGDGAGIAGAESAVQRGRIAALGVAHRLGRIDAARRDKEAAPTLRELSRLSRGRRFLDRLYRPAKAFRVPADDATIVCRCEEVTAKTIRETVALGASGPNEMKSFTRCGMGPCQGRLCGLTVTEMIADACNVSPGEIGYYRLRPPIKPVSLPEIASLYQPDAGRRAAVVQ